MEPKENSELEGSIEDLDNRADVLEELRFRQEQEIKAHASRSIIFLIGFILVIVGSFFLMQPEFMVEIIRGTKFREGYDSHIELAANIKLFGSFFVLISTVFFAYL